MLRCADGSSLSARLVVGADGLRSRVREAAGIAAATKPYGQTAVVANFTCERAHRGRAFQWFHDDGGILAWLPLPGRRVSIVWSAPDALARELLALPAEALAARVAARGRHALGAFESITPSAGFPLQRQKLPTDRRPSPGARRRRRARRPSARRAGRQSRFRRRRGAGRRAARRADPLADPGAPLLLERYARRRAEPVLAMQTVTDALARLFGADARRGCAPRATSA